MAHMMDLEQRLMQSAHCANGPEGKPLRGENIVSWDQSPALQDRITMPEDLAAAAPKKALTIITNGLGVVLKYGTSVSAEAG